MTEYLDHALPHSLEQEVLKMQNKKCKSELNWYQNVPHVQTKKIPTDT